MPTFTPQIVTAYSQDDRVQTLVIPYGATVAGVAIDFTPLIDTGDVIATSTWSTNGTYSSEMAITASSINGTVVTAYLSSTLQAGHSCRIQSQVLTTRGNQLTRSVCYVCETL